MKQKKLGKRFINQALLVCKNSIINFYVKKTFIKSFMVYVSVIKEPVN